MRHGRTAAMLFLTLLAFGQIQHLSEAAKFTDQPIDLAA